jgi:hypothetical protein
LERSRIDRKICVIASFVQPDYRGVGALFRHNSDHYAACAQHEVAAREGVFHHGMLRTELFARRSSESVELLQHAGGAGSSENPNARRAIFRLDREYARGRGDNRDSAPKKYRNRSRLLTTWTSRFVSTSLFPSNLNLP